VKLIHKLGTNRLLNQILVKRFGLISEMIDMTDLELVKSKLRPNTRMIWIETPTNPTLKLIDIEAVVKIAKEISPDIVSVVDNTFASPYNQSPLLLGASVSYNSLTKYIAGHSDLVAGAIATNDKDLFDRIFFNSKSKLIRLKLIV
jgi:cystathionine gamma-lyase